MRIVKSLSTGLYGAAVPLIVEPVLRYLHEAEFEKETDDWPSKTSVFGPDPSAAPEKLISFCPLRIRPVVRPDGEFRLEFACDDEYWRESLVARALWVVKFAGATWLANSVEYFFGAVPEEKLAEIYSDRRRPSEDELNCLLDLLRGGLAAGYGVDALNATRGGPRDLFTVEMEIRRAEEISCLTKEREEKTDLIRKRSAVEIDRTRQICRSRSDDVRKKYRDADSRVLAFLRKFRERNEKKERAELEAVFADKAAAVKKIRADSDGEIGAVEAEYAEKLKELNAAFDALKPPETRGKETSS